MQPYPKMENPKLLLLPKERLHPAAVFSHSSSDALAE
jgi:hypothetical protein